MLTFCVYAHGSLNPLVRQVSANFQILNNPLFFVCSCFSTEQLHICECELHSICRPLPIHLPCQYLPVNSLFLPHKLSSQIFLCHHQYHGLLSCDFPSRQNLVKFLLEIKIQWSTLAASGCCWTGICMEIKLK